ncbi:MAG TPA: two-component regulator propeller domain-containing protein [Bacteroidota bacterium]
MALVLPSSVLGQSRVPKDQALETWKRTLVFKSWKVRDGLPQNTVYGIAQTPDGYLWLTTEEGLVRFDGFRFTVYDKSNTNEIQVNQITQLMVARDSSLWAIASGNGLLRYKNGAFSAVTTQQGLSDDRVFMMSERGDGSIVVRTTKGLDVIRNGTATPLDSTVKRPPTSVISMLESKHGGIWLGTMDGLYYYDDTGMHPYALRSGSMKGAVLPLYENDDGKLYAFSMQAGVVAYRNGAVSTVIALGALGDQFVTKLWEDSTGMIWLATSRGLQVFHQGTLLEIGREKGVITTNVSALFHDVEGNVWVGMYAGGLVQIRKGKFLTYGVDQGLSSNIVFSILPSRDGTLWVGSTRGVDRMVDGRFHHSLLTASGISALTETRDGELWAASLQRGLFRLRKGEFTSIGDKEGLGNYSASIVVAARDGSVWATIFPAVILHFRQGRMERYNVNDSLGIGRIAAIQETSDGSIWFGSLTALSRFSNGSFEVYRTVNGKPIGSILSLMEDSLGFLWIGTHGGGLIRHKDGTFQSITTASGLFHNVVYSLLDDEKGNLWMSCNAGIFRTTKQELNDFFDGRIDRITCANYGIVDGMAEDECNSGSPASTRTKDGTLWFATVGGVASYRPKDDVKNYVLPPVVIEEVLVGRKSVNHASEIILEPGENDLEIRFAALSFVLPEKNRYRYRLLGYSSEWVDAGTRRVAYYTNVPPGKYNFQVIASNSDGVWNETGTMLPLSLEPFFYQTAWFYLLLAVVLASLGGVARHFYGVYRERERVAARLKADLALTQLEMLKAQLKPHFLFNTLNTILVSIRENPDLAVRIVEEFSDLLRSSLEFQGEQVISLRKELEFLNSYLRIQAVRFEGRLTYIVDADPETLDAPVPTLILQPLVENAFTHGFATQTGEWLLKITSKRQNGFLELRVEDNGSGFEGSSEEAIDEGIGLSNTRARLKLLYEKDYSLKLHKMPNGGVEVALQIPLLSDHAG